MSAFLDKLIVTEISDSVFQIYDHPFRYQSDIVQRTFTVPVGFFTDFASVPRIGIIYAMLGDTAHEPAVIHDWLYYSALVPRSVADHVLLEAMGVIGLPAWRRLPIYWGVRVGGWYAWNDHRKKGDPLNGKFQNSPDLADKPATGK
jgi:hypothetical protein